MNKKLMIAILGASVLLTGCATSQDHSDKKDISASDYVEPIEKAAVTLNEVEQEIEGTRLRVGDTMTMLPMIEFVDGAMQEVRLDDESGYKVLYTAPSIDTRVCAEQTKLFNEKAKDYPDVQFFSVTMDLPFSQDYFTSVNGLDNLRMLSDYRTHEFARQNGMLLRDVQLFTRAIFIIDDQNKLIYVDYAEEVNNPSDVANAIAFLEGLEPTKAA